MVNGAIAAAVEKALRDHLILHDQPREALLRVAEEIFTAMDRVAVANDSASAHAVFVVRAVFGTTFEKLWREYGGDLAPPAKYLMGRQAPSAYPAARSG
jgi:hypothetical protein